MPQFDPVTDYLMHYGRKGMKWHKHIFGEKNASKSGNSRFVDNEYQQNLSYNSQSNDYSLTSPTPRRSESSRTNVYGSKEYQQELAYNSKPNRITSRRYTSNNQTSSGRYGPNRSLTVRRPYGQTMQYNQYKNGSEKVNITQRGSFYDTTGTVKYDSNTKTTSVGFKFNLNKRGKAVVSAARSVATSVAFGGINTINRGRKMAAKFLSKRI